MKIDWSMASASDIDNFYGERPRYNLRAIAIRMDGQPVAIIGMVDERFRMRAFSEYKPELEPYRKSITVLRAVKAAQQMFASCTKPIVAVREGCPKILERVGFEQIQDDVYAWRSR